jgi:hypothetical protein
MELTAIGELKTQKNLIIVIGERLYFSIVQGISLLST